MDLEDFDNGTAYAHYGSFGVGLFSVDPEEDGFPLTVADYSGTAGRAPGGGVRGLGGHQSPPPGRTEEVLSRLPPTPRPAQPAGPGGFASCADEQSEPRARKGDTWGSGSAGPLKCGS